MIFILLLIFNTTVYAGVNPSREEIEAIIDEVATKRGIPAILLKGIARVESVFKHFNSEEVLKYAEQALGSCR